MTGGNLCSIMGKRGCGKSTLIHYIIGKTLQTKLRNGIVILDYKGEYVNFLKKRFFYLRVTSKLLRNIYDWEGILRKYPYIIIHPYKLPPRKYQELGNKISLALLEIGQRSFFLDEAHLYFPTHSSLLDGFGTLVTTSRSLGIDFYFVCQRAATINTTAMAEANIRICFQQDEKNDVQQMQRYFDRDISKLKVYEFVAKNTYNHKQIFSDTKHLEKLDEIFRA